MNALWSVIARILFWPRPESLKADIGCWGALGRAIHWVGASLASNCLSICLAGALFAVWREGPRWFNNFENQASESGQFGGIVNGSVCPELLARLARPHGDAQA